MRGVRSRGCSRACWRAGHLAVLYGVYPHADEAVVHVDVLGQVGAEAGYKKKPDQGSCPAIPNLRMTFEKRLAS